MMEAINNRRRRAAEANKRASEGSDGKAFNVNKVTPEMLKTFNIKRS